MPSHTLVHKEFVLFHYVLLFLNTSFSVLFQTEYEEDEGGRRRNKTVEEKEWDKENEKHRDDVVLI